MQMIKAATLDDPDQDNTEVHLIDPPSIESCSVKEVILSPIWVVGNEFFPQFRRGGIRLILVKRYAHLNPSPLKTAVEGVASFVRLAKYDDQILMGVCCD